MDLKEIRTIVNKIGIDETKSVRVKVFDLDGINYKVKDIYKFELMNGDLVFTLKS